MAKKLTKRALLVAADLVSEYDPDSEASENLLTAREIEKELKGVIKFLRELAKGIKEPKNA